MPKLPRNQQEQDIEDDLNRPFAHGKAPMLTPKDLQNIQKRAYAHILQKKYSELYAEHMEHHPDTFFNPNDEQDQLVLQAVQELHSRKRQLSSTHILLTVNVKEEIPLQMMKAKIDKMIKKKWLTDYIIAVEQRGEDNSSIGKGIHFHALLPRAIEPARIRKELASTFKSVCDTSNSHCMNIRWLKEKEIPKVINYLKGQKKDSSKSAKTKMDSIYRTLNGLPDLLYPSTSIMAQEHLTPQETQSST